MLSYDEMRPTKSNLSTVVARWLRYIRFEDPDFERDFLEHDCSSTIPLARFCYLSAVFIWAGFGKLDAAVGADRTTSLWMIRFAVGEPTILTALAMTFIKPLRPWLKHVGLTVTFILGSCVIWMMVILPPPVSDSYYVGVILVLFPAYVFAQVRFLHAVAVSCILVFAYDRLALPFGTISPVTAATNLTFMITTVYIGLVACFLLEWSRRRDFAQAIEIARTHDELRRLSSHDELTRLFNRRRLGPAIRSAIEEYRFLGRDTAIMMIDLDDFKMVNDGFGHATGDRVLKEAAASITDSLQPADSAFRIGGDEFIVLLPSSSTAAAATVASMIEREFTDRCRSVVTGADLPVGMSIGITQIRSGTETATELLRVADEALYQAKLLGKGRVWATRGPSRRQADQGRNSTSAGISQVVPG